MNPVNPKKLMLSKWTATQPTNKEKHFLVIKLIEPEDKSPIEIVELQAVYSNNIYQIAWRDLANSEKWKIGWV